MTVQPLGELVLSISSSTSSQKHVAEYNKQPSDSKGKNKVTGVTHCCTSTKTTSSNNLAKPGDRSTREPAIRTTEQSGDSNELRKQLLGKIQTLLSRYLVYPPVARQRGWQGKVSLAVDVNAIGELRNIRIAKSSGHHLLDVSASTALGRVQRVALADDWQGHTYSNMIVPVRYQLHTR